MPVIVEHAGSEDHAGAARSDGEIVIALINTMPDGAIRATEQQVIGLLTAAAPAIPVRLQLYYLPDAPRAPTAQSVLLRGYREVGALWESRADGVIMTGNVPRAPSLREEPYWDSMTQVFDWAEQHTASSVWSCLAAHAAVLHLDGVNRTALTRKLSGVFDCIKAADHELMADTPHGWAAPHSRQYGLVNEDLRARGYQLLTGSPTAGADIFIKQRRSLFIFLQGHLEYDPHSLFKEYVRDITQFLQGERELYPDMPSGYFDAQITSAFEQFAARAIKERSADLLAVLPASEVQGRLASPWRTAAVAIYRNWLRYLAQQKLAAREPDRAAQATGQTMSPRHPQPYQAGAK